eukprot:TRINITY_DN8955_c0_g1_i2.p1 TRINITY_DN8955_c0_g1~~TRINITY_DN8955_c0_g1_i2.p1  ORF type:complete len:386 (-),score=99.79 TRINITY_DN8955_c0_g1_i2:39-1196(-)
MDGFRRRKEGTQRTTTIRGIDQACIGIFASGYCHIWTSRCRRIAQRYRYRHPVHLWLRYIHHPSWCLHSRDDFRSAIAPCESEVADFLKRPSQDGPTSFPTETDKEILKFAADLTVNDDTSNLVSSLYPTCLRLLNECSDEVVLSHCLVMIGNLASEDKFVGKSELGKELIPICLKFVQDKDKPRLQHLSLGAIRNLSLLSNNKQSFYQQGLFPALVSILSETDRPNAHIQFSSVAIVRVFVAAGTEVVQPWAGNWVQEGGLVPLIRLARGEMRPKELDKDDDGNPVKNPDKRVEYEATRILVRYAASEYKNVLVENGGVDPMVDLLFAPFGLLQDEALVGLTHLAQHDEYKKVLVSAGAIEAISKISEASLAEKANKLKEKLSS